MLIPQQPDDAFMAVMTELENECRKIGLYMNGFILGQTPIEDSSEPVNFVMTTFLVGAEAFDDRVINPEKYVEDGTFRELVDDIDPDEEFLEEVRRRKAEGKGILDD